MNEKQAREILGDTITPKGDIYRLGWFVQWRRGDSITVLDGEFSADDLEAIAWWMRNGNQPIDRDLWEKVQKIVYPKKPISTGPPFPKCGCQGPLKQPASWLYHLLREDPRLRTIFFAEAS